MKSFRIHQYFDKQTGIPPNIYRLSSTNRWFIVERIEEDWMFYVWCSENLAAADAGAVVLGRARLVIL